MVVIQKGKSEELYNGGRRDGINLNTRRGRHVAALSCFHG